MTRSQPTMDAQPNRAQTTERTLESRGLKCIFSVDVEDWFHILDLPTTPKLAAWDALPSRVETNFLKLLDLFSQKNVRVTCFFLGWVAEKFPRLVEEASRRGHEIASHGYSHQLVYKMTCEDFFQDVLLSKKIIEDVVGHRVRGYRSSGFSVTEQTPWFFDKLAEAGYDYDSSVFPGPRGHGGMKNGRYAPYVVHARGKNLLEFPISVTGVFGKPLCFFGGGYLRFFPYSVIRVMTNRVLQEGRPVVFYVHPREIDPNHPRLAMNFQRRFKSYVNLRTTYKKIEHLLADFEVTTFENFVAEHQNYFRS